MQRIRWPRAKVMVAVGAGVDAVSSVWTNRTTTSSLLLAAGLRSATKISSSVESVEAPMDGFTLLLSDEGTPVEEEVTTLEGDVKTFWVVMVTSTVFDPLVCCAPVTHVSVFASSTITGAQRTPPVVTRSPVVASKPLPDTVMVVPPFNEPDDGDTVVTVGAPVTKNEPDANPRVNDRTSTWWVPATPAAPTVQRI